MIPIEAMVCGWCDNVDDLAPLMVRDPATGELVVMSQRCPCPHSEFEFHTRAGEVLERHRAAVRRAR